jgi:signal transduction histidine kinase
MPPAGRGAYRGASMAEPRANLEPTAACTDDRVRVHELAEALRREREARARLEEAALESRNVIHTLNNVLSIVTTCAADLADEIAPGHPSRQSVEEIAEAAGRAGTLARKLGDLQRLAPKGGPSGQGRA